MASTSPKPTEIWLIIALFLGALFLRAYNFNQIGLDHFDEGVYLLSAAGLADNDAATGVYPTQFRFSPPVYYTLVALAAKVTGSAPHQAALWINMLFGSLSVPLLWWVGRRWFGPAAGMAAGVLLAFNEYHISLSRTALTDVLFAFTLLLALWLLVEAVQRQRWPLAVLAGLLVGAAWNTKYHGFFALLIAGLAWLPYVWFQTDRRKYFWSGFWMLAISGIVALACYLPWMLYVQSQPDGYAGLLKYQNTLINSSIFDLQWLRNTALHISQQNFYAGLLSDLSLPLAFMAAGWMSGWRWVLSRISLLVIVLVTLSSVLLGPFVTTAALSLLALPTLLRGKTSYANWVLLAWLGLFTLLTPYYKPYARLLLPLCLAVFSASGVFLQAFFERQIAGKQTQPAARWQVGLAGAAMAVILGLGYVLLPAGGRTWQPAQSMPLAAKSLAEKIPTGALVIVIGEPELAYYLGQQNITAIPLIGGAEAIEQIDGPAYIIAGRYARVAPTLQQALKEMGSRLVKLERIPIRPRDLRLLDDLSVAQAHSYRLDPDNTFDLLFYRLDPVK